MEEEGDLYLVIITGLSGAGKTQAVRALEDVGFFCVDNLPPALIMKFVELCAQSGGKVNRIALVIDIRGGDFFGALFGSLETLKEEGIRYEILFLDASDEELVRRFKESRRRHPLAPQGRILDGIQAERQQLRELKGQAHKVVDTTGKKAKWLKEEVARLFGGVTANRKLAVTVMSFGYKYGVPLDADLVFDVRFLPNPHYVPSLQPLTGNDELVVNYVTSSSVTQQFIRKLTNLIHFLIPHYIKEGKTHLAIALGCTGGQHRSVVLANRIGEFISSKGYQVTVVHRDQNRNLSEAE